LSGIFGIDRAQGTSATSEYHGCITGYEEIVTTLIAAIPSLGKGLI
jgi:hypothetical protein